MEGDVDIMPNNEIKRRLEELKIRTNKRSISFSSNYKSENDVKIENDFFEMMEKQIYKQIGRN